MIKKILFTLIFSTTLLFSNNLLEQTKLILNKDITMLQNVNYSILEIKNINSFLLYKIHIKEKNINFNIFDIGDGYVIGDYYSKNNDNNDNNDNNNLNEKNIEKQNYYDKSQVIFYLMNYNKLNIMSEYLVGQSINVAEKLFILDPVVNKDEYENLKSNKNYTFLFIPTKEESINCTFKLIMEKGNYICKEKEEEIVNKIYEEFIIDFYEKFGRNMVPQEINLKKGSN